MPPLIATSSYKPKHFRVFSHIKVCFDRHEYISRCYFNLRLPEYSGLGMSDELDQSPTEGVDFRNTLRRDGGLG